jgi:polyisoprenyl-phosphate glycosyltransferase
MESIKKISLIIPCYDEQDVIKKTFDTIESVIDSLKKFEFEYIFIDDGSSDDTLKIIRSFKSDNIIRTISFSRNFGHQSAVAAGINICISDAAIIMDADLQDPPYLIKNMLKYFLDGYDVVYAVREQRKGESYFKKITAKIFYRFLNLLSDTKIPNDTGDFRLISKRVIIEFNKLNENDKYIRGLISWIGFKQKGFSYVRNERFAGTTKYPLKKMIFFALNGILSFSTRPLRIATYIGFILSILSFVSLAYVIYLRIFTENWYPGWSAIMFSVLFIGSVQLIAIGILGEYIGRIHNQVKNRPNYIKK